MKFEKIFKGDIDKPMLNKLVVMGEKKMSEFIWHWTNGNNKIYTRRIDVAEKAMKEGILVIGIRTKPSMVEY